MRISVSVTAWSRARSEIAPKLVSARAMAMSGRTRVCIRTGPTTKLARQADVKDVEDERDFEDASVVGLIQIKRLELVATKARSEAAGKRRKA